MDELSPATAVIWCGADTQLSRPANASSRNTAPADGVKLHAPSFAQAAEGTPFPPVQMPPET